MRVLVVGQGGREHVLVWKLAQSPRVTAVFCAPGNAGTALDATNVDISATDIPGLVKFALHEKIDLVIPGPEAPLVAGIADAMEQAGLAVFGPSAKAAELEGSKAFAKQIMTEAKVPTAEYAVFTEIGPAITFLETHEHTRYVIKADGLAAGKGVFVCDTLQQERDAVKQILGDRVFQEAGARVVIEERLSGQEASILALVDGKTILPLETSQDHKAAFDGDVGPNTGGMGAYSPAPIVTPELMQKITLDILIPIVHTLRKKGRPFRGVLYAGIMLTQQGPKVLEFNVRFGDPEAQPVLMRLKSDLAEVLLAGAQGRLGQLPELDWDPRPAVCVVMASEGYPNDYTQGHPIRGLAAAAEVAETKVFHAGTRRQGADVVNAGGRVLGVTAIGDDLAQAKLRAYQAVKEIRWQGAWCRKDISDKARSG